MFNDFSLFSSKEELENNDEADLLAIVRYLSWNGNFKKLGVKSIRASLRCPEGKCVLLERIEKVLPKGWYCKEVKSQTDVMYDVIVVHRNENPVGYLF